MVINHFICAIGIATLFNVFTVSESEKLQCMGEDNKAVDWFIIYKLPKLDIDKANSGDTDSRGKKYLYMSSSTMRSPGWKNPTKLITDLDSMTGNTLKPLYAEGKKDQIWILYNDQPPEYARVKSTCGHTKGVVAANKEGGFWMVHSVPKFPDVPSKYNIEDKVPEDIVPEDLVGKYVYPENGYNNGQTFLCMTLAPNQMEKVATQLQFNEAGVYYSFYSEILRSLYPTLMSVAEKKTYKLTSNQNQVNLKTPGNNNFISFAKSKKYSADIYEKLVAPTLKADLSVETWRNGPRPLDSDCSKDFQVMNVESVSLCVKKACDTFLSTKDHSKWAVSIEKENPWICIGDINRAKSQESRGGGTVCMSNAKVWNSFFQAVNDVEPCTLPTPEATDKKIVVPAKKIKPSAVLI